MNSISSYASSRRRPQLIAVALIFTMIISQHKTDAQFMKLNYPKTKTVEVVDDYHGTKVSDPYRWLEDAEAKETRAWVEEQNRLTESFLREVPARETIRQRLTELWNFPRYGLPVEEGGRYFFTRNDGLQNQEVLYVKERLDAEARLVLDPNKLSSDGTIAITNQVYSKDGKFLAYGLSSGGSDWQEVFYFRTDLEAPHGRIIAIDTNQPDRKNWKVIIPEQNEVIADAQMVNHQLVVAYMRDAQHLVKTYDLKGSYLKDIALPAIGTVLAFSGKSSSTEMFIQFTSFLYPPTILRYDFKTESLTLLWKSDIQFDPSGFETKQVFYHSKDGTRVPMFLVYKKGLALNGDNPTLLYGYGGFNQSMTPTFSVSRLVLLENGGVLAVACLRGGGEYGEDWYRAGTLERKQNVFDDFIAAAEWLIANHYTNTKRLAINGGSNGGLLVAACMLQRPELFGAVLCQVPVTDMLRYHKFTIGRYWVADYGSAENPEQFKFLYAYSPLHNVKPGTSYPPTLITSADTDDRVVPAHAKKFAATLQAAQAGANPILLRVETKAGHGLGKPTSKIIEESTDVYAFMFRILGIGKSVVN